MRSRTTNRFDYALAVFIAVLLIFGILILASVSAVFSQEKIGKATYFLFHQLLFGILPGIILGFIAFKINISIFKKWSWIFVLASLILMILVLIPGLGIVSGGAARWLNFGFFTIQPSEFLKLSFLVYISAWLAKKTEKSSLKKRKNWQIIFFPFLVITGIVALFLMVQSDLSTLLIILISACLIYFSAPTSFWHTVFMVLGGGLATCFLIAYKPYRYNRVLVLLDPLYDPMGLGYQIKQALIAVGSGGIFGLGLGMSRQKFGFIPQTMSDSVFAIFAEEMGFSGSLILIIFFLLFLWRGFRISKNSQDKFSQLFGIGFTSWICLQAFIAIGAMTGIVPLTGIPLPFISYGGSHIVAELIGVGILLNISKTNRK